MASTTLDVKVNFCSLDTRGKPHEEGNGHFCCSDQARNFAMETGSCFTFCIGWIDLSSMV